MALNLSTLTSSATSGDVLAEALTTADFLENVPVLRNLSRGSNKGGDAKQDVALNQPKALPVVDGKGYLYLPSVAGNYASIPDSSDLDITGDITLECDFLLAEFPPTADRLLISKYNTGGNQRSYQLRIQTNGQIRIILSEDGIFNGSFDKNQSFASELTSGTRATVKASWRQSDGRLQFFIKESDGSFTQVGADQNLLASGIYNGTSNLEIGSHNEGVSGVGDAVGVFGAKIYASINDTNKVLDVDFTAIGRHGDTKIKCATGQIVTINTAGNDPSTIIKKPVLRFSDAANTGLRGLFANNIDGGYMFAAFSVLGTGGESNGRVFTVNATGDVDYTNGGAVFNSRHISTNNSIVYVGTTIYTHGGLFDDANGDVLNESKLISGTQYSKYNNADVKSSTANLNIQSDEFNIGQNEDGIRSGGQNASFDLEFLALFSADSVPDEATATKIRDYVNKRNNVFSLVDNSYYFFDPQKATFTGNFTGANTLDGYITGSDNGDTDVRTNLTLEQSTLNDQPSTDGYTITFNDAAEHLEFENAASQNLSGWQVCGTSLGTFVYRVQGAVTELNLLGNAGGHRSVGDSYGMILLPESATGADIEAARSLLIDRGAADGTTASSYQAAWYLRSEIKEFKSVNMTGVTNVESAWNSSGLISFDTPLPSAAIAKFAFYNCTQLSDFRTTDIKNGTDFTGCWQLCSALTSFPAGAKLGTSASNVNFTSAWQDSGLTSFPALDLSSGTTFFRAWQSSDLISFPANIDLSGGTDFTDAWRNINTLLSFPAGLNLSSGQTFDDAWRSCTSLTGFPLITISSGKRFRRSWYNCSSMTDWPSGFFDSWSPSDIFSGVFNDTWVGCYALTAQSVENILTSIDASGKYGTATGAAGGGAIDSGIDIDYDGTTLSAATNSAIDSLSGKGWEVYINGVLVIPNILDLAPAAAYSLRSFDADADPNVVKVRRSSDGALSDFKASEVSDGTLTSWVNAVNPQVMDNPDITSASNWALQSSTTYNSSTEAFDLASEVGLTVRQSKAVAGQTYQVTLVIPTMTSGGVKVYAGGTQSDPVTSAGTHVVTITAGSSNAFIALNPYGSTTASIASFHALQTTADGHVTTWYDQGGTNHASQPLVSNMPKLVDAGTLVTEGGLPALDFNGINSFVELQHSDLYGQSVLDSYYVTSTTDASYIYPASGLNNPYGMVAQATSNSSNILSYYGSPDFYANGSQITGTTRGDIYTATSGGQKLVAHLGADTSITDWSNMLFGRYTSTTAFAYDGKLQEMIFFNTDQSANRTGIENNINDTYTIY